MHVSKLLLFIIGKVYSFFLHLKYVGVIYIIRRHLYGSKSESKLSYRNYGIEMMSAETKSESI